jgi:hypothetical protein
MNSIATANSLAHDFAASNARYREQRSSFFPFDDCTEDASESPFGFPFSREPLAQVIHRVAHQACLEGFVSLADQKRFVTGQPADPI